MEGLIEGRIVHYVHEHLDGSRVHRAALVIHVEDRDKGIVQLLVFLSPEQDRASGLFQINLHTEFDPTNKAGTWHWIERE